jgi:putative ABC transport system permease protein
MVTAFLDDVRDAARSVRRAASFSLVAILTLTLSLVASTTLLSVLNALVLRTLPVDSPRELAVISLADPRTGQMRFVYLSTFEAFQRRQKSFETVTPYSGGGTFRIDVRGERVDGR